MTMTSEVKLEPTAEEIERVAEVIVEKVPTLTLWIARIIARAAILAMDRRASPAANAEAKVFGWARGVNQPSTPHDPAEYDIDFVYGDDEPAGDGWFPVYASPPAPAVAVKPLEWIIQPYYWEAMTPFGRYGAWESESNPGLSYWKAPEDVARREVSGDLMAAKAAAQKHYGKLVSALVEPAPAVAVGDFAPDPADAALIERLDAKDWRGVHSTLFRLTQSQAGRLRAMLAAAPQPPATRSYEEGKRWVAPGDVSVMYSHINSNWRVVVYGRPTEEDADRLATAIRSLADEPRHGE